MRTHLYLFILLIISPWAAIAQPGWGSFKGTVTFRTDDDRLHADAGAEVIIYYIDSVKNPDSAYASHRIEDSIVNTSFLATIYYMVWEHSPYRKTQKAMVKKLRALDAYPADRLSALDKRATEIISEREGRQYAKATTDAGGHYAMKLRAGYYGVIIRSKHVKSHSVCEGNGNILLDNLPLKAGQTVVRNEEIL